MKRVQFIRLRYVEGKSDKIYEAELCELPGSDQERFVVNFRYGRFGTKLREGSKTSYPVSREKGQKIFNSLVVAKISKGYRPVDTDTDTQANGKSAPVGVAVDMQQTNPLPAVHSKILFYLNDSPSHRPLSRIIWRAGELAIPEAADRLTELIGSGDVTMDYSIAWALGRCGRESHAPALEPLLKSRSSAVRRIALEAFLAIAPSSQVAQQLEKVRNALPTELQRSLDQEDHQELTARLLAALSAGSEKNLELLENFYTVALHSKCAHLAIVNILRLIPFQQENYFRAFRHILKRSEFRLDGDVFATIALRIEQTEAQNWSRIFSKATREYLRRRVWRTLRKLGEADNDRYVSMAAALLATITDEHGKEPREIVRTEYNWQTRSSEVVSVIKTDWYSEFLAFNHILYEHSEQYRLSVSRKFWHKVAEAADSGRTEAFPKLWDKQPEIVLSLLQNSYCSAVHTFCVKILRDNEQFCRSIPVGVVSRLLCSVYEVTGEFVLEIAKEIYDPINPDATLLAACLEASYAPAREQGRRWLDEQPALLKDHPDVLVAALLTPFSDLREWLVAHISGIDLPASEAGVLIEKVIDRALLFSEEDRKTRLPAITELLVEHFRSGLQQLEISCVGRLVEDERAEIQLFGARLLLHLDVRGEALPDNYLALLSNSPDAEIRSAGVSLLGKFEDSYLLERQQLLFSFCISEHASIRQAVQPLIKRLAGSSSSFAETLFQELIQNVFSAEKVAGQHDDIINLLTEALAAELRAIDKNLRWRLIHARSKAAQRLGAISLQDTGYSTYSVRQWAEFANCQEKMVRDWAMAAYEAEPEKIRANAADALRLLNSSWDDSREFGIRYFRKQFNEDDWNPDLIVGICDNTRDDIQRFGRELITEFFHEGDGALYLNRLSQHPSRNVQLFTTNFLISYAKDDVAKLTRLKPYFLTVLSQVRKGRVAKDRVMKFLTEEALKSEEAAQLVGDVFNRQSATCSIQDQAAYIEGMCAISEAYPDVKLPLVANRLPIKEVRNAI